MKNTAAAEVKACLDAVIVKVERIALSEQRRIEREIEKRESQKRKEEQRREREVDLGVSACMERIIRKLERDHAGGNQEDGQPYLDAKRKVHRCRLSLIHI